MGISIVYCIHRYLLYYLHGILQRQQARYQIVVVEQDDLEIFNKAQLMNTGFSYLSENTDFECFYFHDVDLIGESDRIIYKCSRTLLVFWLSYELNSLQNVVCPKELVHEASGFS